MMFNDMIIHVDLNFSCFELDFLDQTVTGKKQVGYKYLF